MFTEDWSYRDPKPIDLASWPRRDHFKLFCSYDEPFFSIVFRVDCTELLQASKKCGQAPTLGLWHGVVQAANDIEAFRLRIIEGHPVVFETVHLSATVLREDETFAIALIPYLPSRTNFVVEARKRVEQARQSRGLHLDLDERRPDLIHFSTLPWFAFTGLTHARKFSRPESEPKIVLGRFEESAGHFTLPVSVTAHHALVDGLQVAQFKAALERAYSL